jgi:hypothetical protein
MTFTRQFACSAAAVISASVPISPGRTTCRSSSRNTGVRATSISSRTWRLALSRWSAFVNRLTLVSRIRCASSQMRTSRLLGGSPMKVLK